MIKDFTNKDINHIKNKDLEYITFNILNKYNLKHAFFLKKGGVSKGIYSSLNFRFASEDSLDNILKNIDIVKEELKLKDIYKADQTHSDNILVIDSTNKEKYLIENLNKEAYDAYITNEKDLATLVTTADCNPIIIYDPILKVVANIHSGWKGTIQKIYIKTVKLMQERYNSNPKDLIVCIGPSINSCCFVSSEISFKEMFTKVWKDEEEYIKNIDGVYHIDLTYVIKKDLIELGVKEENIVLSNVCTLCNEDSFFSYRASKRNKEISFATQANIVSL